ncbi:MAG: hypothetical protein HY368_02040 [Candidatus Aenigmarchaeota archaeon]|nr:hypothetical protein [Candidatus Aenigmarchaeota archaeon]
MVTFETVKSEEIKFGSANFLEIARKKAVSEEGENEFISISRGFMTRTGERRYKKSIAVPVQKEILDFLADALKKMQ